MDFTNYCSVTYNANNSGLSFCNRPTLLLNRLKQEVGYDKIVIFAVKGYIPEVKQQ